MVPPPCATTCASRVPGIGVLVTPCVINRTLPVCCCTVLRKAFASDGSGCTAVEKVLLTDLVMAEVAGAEKDALNSRDANMPKPEELTLEVYDAQDAAPAEISSKPKQPKADSTRKMPSR